MQRGPVPWTLQGTGGQGDARGRGAGDIWVMATAVTLFPPHPLQVRRAGKLLIFHIFHLITAQL